MDMRQSIKLNIVNNSNLVSEFLELKNETYGDKNEVDEVNKIKEMRLLKSAYEHIKLLIKGVSYSSENEPLDNAILCVCETFLDYLDEFIYLYETKRYTLIPHCARGILESFLAMLTIRKHKDGLDIFKNTSDYHQMKIQLDGVTNYEVGDSVSIRKSYLERVGKRKTDRRLTFMEQAKLFEARKDYDSGDLYLLYRYLSKETHFSIDDELSKRYIGDGKELLIKSQKQSTAGLTLPLHMNILSSNLISEILEYSAMGTKSIYDFDSK